MEEVKQSHFFKPWTTGSRDAVGNASTPIELPVLGVLTGSLLSTSIKKEKILIWLIFEPTLSFGVYLSN